MSYNKLYHGYNYYSISVFQQKFNETINRYRKCFAIYPNIEMHKLKADKKLFQL